MARGDSPDQTTRLLVWGRAGGVCQFENCTKRLDQDLIAGNLRTNKAYLAHIVASDPNGPRGEENRSRELSNDPANLMLMCDEHHREIDGPDTWRKYPEARLLEMKRQREEWIALILQSGMDSRSHILQVSAPIGDNETAIPFDDCIQAIMPGKTPAESRPIDIKIRGMRHKDSDPQYWLTEISNLRIRFEREVYGRFENGDIRHLSVFALAPIPMLIELGRLLSDIRAVDVYERHREPVGQWVWPEDGPEVDFAIKPGALGTKRVALKLAITSEIEDDRIRAVLGSDVSIWTLESSIHNRGIIRRRSDLSRFRETAGRVLDMIKNQHGMDASLSVFPAIPVSCAVEFGRVWQPKAHLPMEIFDQAGETGFCSRLKIQ